MNTSTNSSLTGSLPGPVGFVLGGGGSLGAAQVGMLQALAEHDIHADLVTGTSIGAINAAVVAADPIGAANRLSHLWHTLDAKAILPGGLSRRLWTLLRYKTYLYDTPGIAKLVEDEIGDMAIEDLQIPYAAVALDVETATPSLLTSGRLSSAILASSAIPGVFPAVERNGRRLYDGGLVTNVPVLEALDMGAKSLVVLDCAFPDQEIASPTDMAGTIFYAITVQMRQQALRDMPIAGRDVPVLYLPGPPPSMVSPLDFSQTPALVRGAYRSSRAFLDTVSVNGPGLYRYADATRVAVTSSQPG